MSLAIEDQNLDVLVAKLAEGDRSAFTPAFRLLWTPMLRLCTTLLKNDADATDAAQQAMYKVLERGSDYDPKRPALPWALAIAGWECRTILRKRSRRREVAEDLALELPDPAAETNAEQRMLVESALAAMGTLSQGDREALVAAFWEQGDSQRGATVRKRRERALKRLRDAFRRLYGID
jgi:RNA polymerase sigma-70 factor (ECF subfamily)